MKVLILNGSARGKKGVTGRVLRPFIDGLVENGVQVKEMEVSNMNISPCISCFSCMHKTPGVCSIKDDMAGIYKELKESDILVLATPVYADNMSSQLKAVIDRCICSLEPYLRKDEYGRVRHSYVWRMPPKVLLIAVSGFPEMETFGPIIATFRAQGRNYGVETIGEICIPGSIALQVEPERLKNHIELLHRAGEELSREGRIGNELLGKLNVPPLSVEEYLSISTRYEMWCRKRLKQKK
ncbi:MAG: flavodoxin family protein [Syntrophorhabdaceae bacterium]|nr:flavodoxin family protein [Syntrophorhabdaceae bacterium]